MYYIIGDIHGNLRALIEVFRKIMKDFNAERDTMIFLGDYIDRGDFSFETIDFLIKVSKEINTVFIRGNHEDMFQDYIKAGLSGEIFLHNGGKKTIASYKRNAGSVTLPESHKNFFDGLALMYESSDFIAVHAGLDPLCGIGEQKKERLLWIRDEFYTSSKRWPKTVVFGHTSVSIISGKTGVYFDDKRNIIGIDNGAAYGRPLACLRLPDRKVYYSNETGARDVRR
ncbi:MAG: serine/threonine protein phosphatase [Leptospirales bacterium]|nr:serine/threonine protein phosphatase [Leptospirales bacterium]